MAYQSYKNTTTNPSFKTKDGKYYCITFPSKCVVLSHQQLNNSYDIISLPSKKEIEYEKHGQKSTTNYQRISVKKALPNGNGLSHAFVPTNGKWAPFIKNDLDKNFLEKWNYNESKKTMLKNAFTTETQKAKSKKEKIQTICDTINEHTAYDYSHLIKTKSTPHYSILSPEWVDNLLKKEQDTQKQLLLKQCANDYNIAVKFANERGLDIENLNITSNDTPSLDEFIQHRTEIYKNLCDACKNDGIDVSEIPEMGTIEAMENDTSISNDNSNEYVILKKPTIDVNKAVSFNIERGLQHCDANGNPIKKQFKDGQYTSSYNTYAFSEFEQRRLEAGENIIITECPTGNDKYCNVLCHLQQAKTPTADGNTHELVIDKYVKITSPIFADASLNEKYHLQQERFDALIAASQLGRELQIQHAKTKGKRERRKFETIEDKSHKAHGYDKDGTMTTKNTNLYFLDSYLEINRESNLSRILSKEFRHELKELTKQRTVNKLATEKGQNLGFETLYDERRFEKKSKHAQKTIKRINEAIEYASTHGVISNKTKYEYLESAKTYKELYEIDCNRYETEKQMRQQPVSDVKLKDQYINNAFEEYVYNRYNEIHSNNDNERITRESDENYINDRYATLQRSITVRKSKRTADRDIPFESNDTQIDIEIEKQ